jgi:hypothetical protein
MLPHHPLIPETFIHTVIDDAISLESQNLVGIVNEWSHLSTGNTFYDTSLLVPTVSLSSDHVHDRIDFFPSTSSLSRFLGEFTSLGEAVPDRSR